MPIYDYRCDHCGHAFSAVQSFKDEPLEKCPNCGKKPRRLIVAPAVVFKGSGWYKTDSRGQSPKEGDSNSPSDHSRTTSESPKEGESAKSGDHRGAERPATKDTKTPAETSKSGKSEGKS